MAGIKIEISVPASVTAVITKDAAQDLNLKAGDQVEAVIKSTGVMIVKVVFFESTVFIGNSS